MPGQLSIEKANQLFDELRQRKLISDQDSIDLINALTGLSEYTNKIFLEEIPVLEGRLQEGDRALILGSLERIRALCLALHQQLYDGHLIPRERRHWND